MRRSWGAGLKSGAQGVTKAGCRSTSRTPTLPESSAASMTRTHVGGRLRSAALRHTLSLVWRREGEHNRQCLPSKPTGWWRMRAPGCTPRGRRSPGPGERTRADNQSRVRKARKSNDLLKTCGPRPELVVGGPLTSHTVVCAALTLLLLGRSLL